MERIEEEECRFGLHVLQVLRLHVYESNTLPAKTPLNLALSRAAALATTLINEHGLLAQLRLAQQRVYQLLVQIGVHQEGSTVQSALARVLLHALSQFDHQRDAFSALRSLLHLHHERRNVASLNVYSSFFRAIPTRLLRQIVDQKLCRDAAVVLVVQHVLIQPVQQLAHAHLRQTRDTLPTSVMMSPCS